MTEIETATTPACWCSYGNEGTEFIRFPRPGCPEHDPNGDPDPDDVHDGFDDHDSPGCMLCNCDGCDGCMSFGEYVSEVEGYKTDPADLACCCGSD